MVWIFPPAPDIRASDAMWTAGYDTTLVHAGLRPSLLHRSDILDGSHAKVKLKMSKLHLIELRGKV